MEIDGYSITRELTRGPITTVYLAQQDALERSVLVKVLNQQWHSETDLIERFRREALICARLKHPNVVQIFDFSTDPQNLYLIQEFIDGQDLESLLTHHPLPFSVIRHITHGVLQGLAYAHSLQVVHRDIKPANIMIGNDGSVKLTDFGLAKMPDSQDLTIQGGTVGTPAYMSPEQAQGKKLDAQSDLFNLGATLYHLCSGSSPFQADNLATTIQQILESNPPAPKELRADIPEWFSNKVEQLLDKRAEKRPAAASLADDDRFAGEGNQTRMMINFLSDPLSLSPEPSSDAVSASKTSRTRLLLLLVPLLLLAFFFIIGGGSDTPVEDEPRQTTSPAIEKASERIAATDAHIDPVEQSAAAKGDIDSANNPDTPATNEDDLGLQAEAPLENTDKPIPTSVSNIAESEARTGQIMITCDPWADILIDEQQIDTTPLSSPLTLAAGTHLLTFKNPHFETRTVEVTIAAGQADTLHVELVPALGYLQLRIRPWADIYLNGEKVGVSPLADPLEVKAGKYALKLINPAYATYIDSIDITAGQTLQKTIFLKK